jgi:hypothetical protein
MSYPYTTKFKYFYIIFILFSRPEIVQLPKIFAIFENELQINSIPKYNVSGAVDFATLGTNKQTNKQTNRVIRYKIFLRRGLLGCAAA